MIDIPVKDADSREPLPVCRGYREFLVSSYKLGEMIVLRFFSDDASVNESSKADELKAVEHIWKCPRCRPWVHSIVPESVIRRQQRLSRYCCAGMFCAVEEYQERGKPRFEFSMFRGEDPCWKIDGANAFASFCPWCGKKLPDKPFISEE